MTELAPEIQLENKQIKIRFIRDEYLKETDWWAVSDRVMTQAEIDYRQALRDIPSQDGFPNSVVWPTNPHE